MTDPRNAGDDERRRALIALAVGATEAPWRLSGDDRRAAHAAGLADPELIHVVALAGLFGHLNRVADAVDIELDYSDRFAPPPAGPQAPWPVADGPVDVPVDPALALDNLEMVAERFAAWRAHVLDGDRPLATTHRRAIAREVAILLGDPGAAALPAGDDPRFAALARTGVTEPWALGHALAPLRATGLDDASLFDAAATVASATAWSRIEVALRALSRA